MIFSAATAPEPFRCCDQRCAVWTPTQKPLPESRSPRFERQSACGSAPSKRRHAPPCCPFRKCKSPAQGHFPRTPDSLRTLMVRSAPSFHSDVEAAADAARFSVAAAHVFSAFAASVADAAVPSAVFSLHHPSAAPPADVPGLVFVAASASPVLASGTSFLVPFGISRRFLDFPSSAPCPTGSPLSNRSDQLSWPASPSSPPGSCYFPTGCRFVARLD